MQKNAIGFAIIALFAGACATGVAATDRDGGIVRPDAGKGNDGSTTPPKDSGAKDTSAPIQDGSTCNFTVCGTLCIDTTGDDNNCGQCGNACQGGSTCANSQCACSGGMTLCNSVCTDTMSDNSNCGACNNPCGTTETCMSGTCQSQGGGGPPQGTCAHDLCTADIGALTQGCDPSGCVDNVCLNDSFCCDTEWDSACVSEVATYCSPYTCP